MKVNVILVSLLLLVFSVGVVFAEDIDLLLHDYKNVSSLGVNVKGVDYGSSLISKVSDNGDIGLVVDFKKNVTMACSYVEIGTEKKQNWVWDISNFSEYYTGTLNILPNVMYDNLDYGHFENYDSPIIEKQCGTSIVNVGKIEMFNVLSEENLDFYNFKDAVGVRKLGGGKFVFDVATVTLYNSSDVDFIARCDDASFDWDEGDCGNWVKTNTPFNVVGDDIVFNVASFSAYRGLSSVTLDGVNLTSSPVFSGGFMNLSGLVAWWRLENSNGSFEDSSGSGNSGISSEVVNSYDCMIGGCGFFDGIDDVINVSFDEQFNSGDFSIEAWVKVDGNNGSNSDKSNSFKIFSKENATSGYDFGVSKLGFPYFNDENIISNTWSKYNNLAAPICDSPNVCSTPGQIGLGSNGRNDDGRVADSSLFISDDGTFTMIYSSFDGGNLRSINTALSSDGLNWMKYNNFYPANCNSPNPCGTPGQVGRGTGARGDNTHIAFPFILKDDNDYKLYYTGHNGAAWRLYIALSSDGMNWTKYNNVVPATCDSGVQCDPGRLGLGSGGKGDDAQIVGGTAIKDDDGTYKMWYLGNDGAYRIYYATSPNGYNWTKYNNTVPHTCDTGPCGTPGQIGLGSGGTGDSSDIISASVIKDNGVYKMAYSAANDSASYRTYYAYSYDSLNWFKYNNTVPFTCDTGDCGTSGQIGLGTAGKEDDFGMSWIDYTKIGNIYYLWYSGQSSSTHYVTLLATITAGVVGSELSKDSWNHLVATKNSSHLSLFVNGVFDSTLAQSVSSNNSNQVLIGDLFNGSLDEVRFWNRSLTLPEIGNLSVRVNSFGNVSSSQDLACNIVNSNELPSNTSVSYVFDWRLFNTSIAVLNMPFDLNGSVSLGPEILADGDMEAGGVSAWAVGNNANLSKETTSPHSGLQSLRVAYNDTTNPDARQVIVTSGKTYRVTGYARSGGSAVPAIIQFMPRWTGNNSTEWQPINFTFLAGVGAVRFRAVTSGAGYVEFDDFSIVESISNWTTVNDYSSFGNIAEYNGSVEAMPTWNRTGGYDGKGAYKFDGIDDGLSIPDNDLFSFTNGASDLPFSGTMWVKKRIDIIPNRFSLLTKYDTTDSNREYQFSINNNALTVEFAMFNNDNPGNRIGRKAPPISVGDWHFLAFTYNGSETEEGIKIYTDGIRSDNDTDSDGAYSGMTNGGSPVGLGKNHVPSDNLHLNGSLDNVQLWNRTLSDAQIQEMYADGVGRYNVLKSSETSDGDNFTCVSTSFDNSFDGSFYQSNTLLVGAISPTPPTVSVVSINWSRVYNSSGVEVNLTSILAGGTNGTFNATVDNNDDVSTIWVIIWTTVSDALDVLFEGIMDLVGGFYEVVFPTNTSFGHYVNYSINVNNTEGIINTTNGTFLYNYAPVSFDSLNITQAYGDTWANFTVTYIDAGGDLGIVYFNLTVNDTLVASETFSGVSNGSSVSWIVDPNNWSSFDNLSFKSQAYDGLEYTTANSTNLTSLNYAPYSTDSLNVTTIFSNTWANFSVYYFDNDTNPGTVYVNLTVNDTVVASETFTSVSNGTGVSWIVDPNNWSRFDNVSFKSQAFDGFNYTTANSTNLTVSNVFPTLTDSLNITSAFSDTWANFSVIYTDTGGDIGTVYVNLTVEDSVVSSETFLSVNSGESVSWIVDPANWSNNEEISFKSWSYDGYNYSNSNTTNLTSLNYAPYSTDSLNVSLVYTNTWANFSVYYFDNDTNPGTVYVNLTVNDTVVASETFTSASNGTGVSWIVDPNNWSHFDNISFKSLAYDGFNYTTSNTTNATVNNSIPTTPQELISDNSSNLPLLSWLTSTDADGDNIIYNLDISNSSGFTIINFTNASIIGNQMKINFNMSNGTWYWRVLATDSYDNSSFNLSSFSIPPPPLPRIIITAPKSNTTVFINPFNLRANINVGPNNCTYNVTEILTGNIVRSGAYVFPKTAIFVNSSYSSSTEFNASISCDYQLDKLSDSVLFFYAPLEDNHWVGIIVILLLVLGGLGLLIGWHYGSIMFSFVGALFIFICGFYFLVFGLPLIANELFENGIGVCFLLLGSYLLVRIGIEAMSDADKGWL